MNKKVRDIPFPKITDITLLDIVNALQIELFLQPSLTVHHLDTIFYREKCFDIRTDRLISDYI